MNFSERNVRVVSNVKNLDPHRVYGENFFCFCLANELICGCWPEFRYGSVAVRWK